jgi:DNA-directed RNA polymerase specialized sigma subunit
MRYSQRNNTIRRIPEGLSLPLEDQGTTKDYLPLILKLTHENWAWRGPNGGASFEDAVSESILALLQVKSRRDGGPIKLITYAYHRIACAPLDLLKVETRYASRFLPTAPRDLPLGVDSDTEARLSNSILWSRVRSLMRDRLTGIETLVLLRYFFHERTEAEIAEELQVKPYRVPLIRNAALATIRSAFPPARDNRRFVA